MREGGGSRALVKGSPLMVSAPRLVKVWRGG